MKIKSSLLVQDANFNKKIIIFSILSLSYLITLILLFSYLDAAKNPYIVIIMGALFFAIIILFWKFPKRCSKDGLPMKYNKITKRHFGCLYKYYRCPKGHILKERIMDMGPV